MKRALIGGHFDLLAGTTLQLAVGGMGTGSSGSGGGGSYNADLVTGWSQAGAGLGNGSITINLIEEAVTTPEPASATLAVLGLFALAAIRRRR